MSQSDPGGCVHAWRSVESSKAGCGGIMLGSTSCATCLLAHQIIQAHHGGMPGKLAKRLQKIDFQGRCYGLRKVWSLMFGTPPLHWWHPCCCDPCDQAGCGALQQAMPLASLHEESSRVGRAERSGGQSGVSSPAGLSGWGQMLGRPSLCCHPFGQCPT